MQSKNLALRITLLFVLTLLTGTLFSQTSKGILAGTVRDSSGAAIAGASLTVTSQETGETRTITTTPLGSYRIEAINPGHYEIRVSTPGFATTDLTDLNVLPSVVTTYDPKLAVGDVGVSVTVEANSNALNTDNGQLSGTIDTQELAKVPIFSLSPFELVATLPGVQLVNPALNLFGAGGNYEQLTANGARPRSNNFLLDGQDINDVGIGGQSFNPQVPDMYQSLTTLLNSSSAEYGRSGGAIVNLITKSGSNQFHGTVFELYSGSGLNALDGVTREGKVHGTPPPGYLPPVKARYDQHQYGFTAGGPLWKDKLFGFGGTQFTRFYGKAISGQILLPDAAGYSQLTSIAATSPTARSQVAILQGLLNSGSYLTSYALLAGSGTKTQAISAANCPGNNACVVEFANFQRPPVAQQSPDTQWMYRIDFIPRASDTFTFRYLHDRANFTPDLSLNTSGLPGFDGEVGGPTELAQGTWTHILTPNLLNEFRASEVRLSSQFTPTAETLANPLSKNFTLTLSGVGINDLGVSQNIPQGRIQQLYQFQDTVGWTKGKQSLRIGADVGRDHETDLISQNALGTILFAKGGNGASQLDNFVSDELGSGGTITKTFGPTRTDPHLWKLAGFVQDDIKLTADLSVNLGLRYDYDTNPENALPFPAIDIQNPYAPVSTVVPVKADKNNFAPRFGFAFSPHSGFFHDGKTVFHGGFGVFYDLNFTNILINAAQSSPNAPTSLITGSAANNFTPNAVAQLATFTPVLSPRSSILSVSNNLVNPVTYQYNAGMERELPGQIKVTLNYVGASGKKLFANEQLNRFEDGVRVNPARGAVSVRANAAGSNYNSAQVDISRSFSHGVSFRAVYAFSKNLDDASEVFALFNNPNTSYSANLSRIAQDYGRSAFDRQHVASFEYVYSPAGFRSSHFAANLLLGALTRNYTVSGTTQFSSGPYSSFQISGLDTSGDLNSSNDRPLVANAHAPITTVGIDGFYIGGTPGVYYDYGANNSSGALNPVTLDQVHFLIPNGSQYVPHELGRNSFENPGQAFWNAAAEKAIPVGFRHFENGEFILRAEGQNLGNHNNVSVLDTNLLDVGSTSYLNKSAVREPTFQNFRLWAKFIF